MNFKISPLIRVVLLLIIMQLSGSAYSQEEKVAFDGNTRENVINTTVSIIPPKGFIYAGKNQAAFIKNDQFVIIQVNDFKDSVFTVEKADKLMEQHIKTKELQLLNRKLLKTNKGQTCVLYGLVKTAKDKKGKDFKLEKLMLLTGNANKLIWLDSVYPELLKGQVYRDLYESLMTLEF